MTNGGKHRVGLVGAGHISEFHVAALERVAGVEIVGVFDLDGARAQALADKHGLRTLPSLAALRGAGADVIHVLTPPHTHAAVAMDAIERGCHVFVEKPLATDVEDVERIRAAAAARKVEVCVGHSLLFDPQVRSALDDVRRGALGELVAVDVIRSSSYPPYEGGPLPPQYRTAGYPFRDLGIHALYLIEAFLGRIEDVDARWASLGGDPNLAFDEWRALVRCQRGLGQVHLSWNVRPMQSQLLLQGTRGVRRVDLFLMFQATRHALPVPKPAERVLNAASDSVRPLVEVPANVAAFATGRIRQYHGLQELVAAFYRSLDAGEPPPVTIDDARSSVHFTEVVARAADRDAEAQRTRLAGPSVPDRRPMLVTGASGGLGSALVERLRAEGVPLRLLVRRAPRKPPEGVEIIVGDLGDPDAVDRAVEGTSIVFHVGAAMKGGWPEHQRGTVTGTRNVVDACLRHGVDKLVHTSSMSVIAWAGAPGAPVDEDTVLEPHAERRGAYTRAKLEAERLVVDAVTTRGLRAVILRPGQIFGRRLPLLTGAIARKVGRRYLVLGDGTLPLPLVYIDDVVDALLAAARGPVERGEIIQLVDPEVLTQNDVLALVAGDAPVVRVPRMAVMAGGALSEAALGLVGRDSPLSVYRLESALASRTFRSKHAEALLGWSPRVGVREGIRRTLMGVAADPPRQSAPSQRARAEAAE